MLESVVCFCALCYNQPGRSYREQRGMRFTEEPLQIAEIPAFGQLRFESMRARTGFFLCQAEGFCGQVRFILPQILGVEWEVIHWSAFVLLPTMGARAASAAPKRRNIDRNGSLCHLRSLDTSTGVAAREFIPGIARHQDGNLRWADEGWEVATLLP